MRERNDTVRSAMTGTLDKDEQKILYKINNTNTELDSMLKKCIIIQLLREIDVVQQVIKMISTHVFSMPGYPNSLLRPNATPRHANGR